MLLLARAALPLSLADCFFTGEELAHGAISKALLDGPTRLRSVIRQFHQQHELRQLRQTEAALEQRTFNHEEELSVLSQMIAAKRRQQGITAPTDG